MRPRVRHRTLLLLLSEVLEALDVAPGREALERRRQLPLHQGVVERQGLSRHQVLGGVHGHAPDRGVDVPVVDGAQVHGGLSVEGVVQKHPDAFAAGLQARGVREGTAPLARHAAEVLRHAVLQAVAVAGAHQRRLEGVQELVLARAHVAEQRGLEHPAALLQDHACGSRAGREAGPGRREALGEPAATAQEGGHVSSVGENCRQSGRRARRRSRMRAGATMA
mmetsp:Transcript_33684/g.105513  ORF Transcript_33684/g.105513 Transcript_33684/m.105513 type:complete len:223 (+) Transcript_33684:398-1066(+)